MKKSFKLLLLFFVFATTFLSGCSEEIYDDHLHEQKQNITTRRIKSDELFRDKKVVVELNNVKSFLSSENQLSNQRLVNINGYIIETDDVLLTEYAGIKSYTFPIYEINAEKLKNLVIAEKLDGTYVSKIFEYDLTPSEKIDLENDELKTIQNPVNVLRLSNETLSYGCGFETIIVYIPCSQGVHNSSNLNDWYRCEASVQPSIKVIERLVCGDDGGGGGSLFNTTGSNPIDYTPVGGSASLNNSFPNESTNPNDFENGITQPVLTSIDGISEEQLNINLFQINLDSQQQNWVNENNNTYNQMIQYLINTNQGNNIWSVESKDFVEYAINHCINENTPQEEKEEIINVFDLLDDGLINGQSVIDSSDPEITNMADYLSCFNLNQSAILTIYADQPKAGTHNLFSLSKTVGHSFISIKQGTKIKSLGYYPKTGVGSILPNNLSLDPNDFLPTPAVFKNNEEHSFDVSISVQISSSQLTSLVNGTISLAQSNPFYNIASMNCTDLAIILFEGNTTINIPSCESPFSIWDGQTPGTLGEVLRDITLPVSATRNTTGRTAPNNSSN